MHKKQGCSLAFLTQNNSLKKSSKKVLTKGKESGKIVKLSARAVATILTLKNLEKNLKKFQKGIDKGERLWYNTKAVARKRAAERSLKIEQQEISTKQKASANLVKELYILNKVKEAKKE